ncbi:uncharacterized protein LOC143185044 [Calliopsis andreniformis]|uniref:uncharacterized protein LOC143185044 n=1 Tax=Calliopsis andreniformis TaxID=337506 RepID=UPI003FCE287A
MNIYKDIQKVTQIPYTEENALFIRQRDPRPSRRNQRMHVPRPPRNANLYDCDNDDNETKYNVTMKVNEHEIASSIKEVSCGIDYSNESLEEHWRRRQETSRRSSTSSDDTLMFKKSPAKVIDKPSTSKTQIDDKKNIVDEEYVLKQCKLDKNAAIRGLLKNQKISLNDLQIPDNVINVGYGNNTNIQNENIPPPTNLTEENYNIKLVQCPEDPDVFIRPLQANGRIDESKYKDIDFSVPHIGKKRIVTPRQFYVQMDVSGFDFVKKKYNEKGMTDSNK